MILTYRANRFTLSSSYEERDVPKQAGFRWNSQERCWQTDDVTTALKLLQYADAEAEG